MIAVSMTYLVCLIYKGGDIYIILFIFPLKLVTRSKNTRNDTKDVISRLIRLVVETGVLTGKKSRDL